MVIGLTVLFLITLLLLITAYTDCNDALMIIMAFLLGGEFTLLIETFCNMIK